MKEHLTETQICWWCERCVHGK